MSNFTVNITNNGSFNIDLVQKQGPQGIAGGIIVKEVDNSPSVLCTDLVFPNNSLTVDGSTVTVNIAGGGGGVSDGDKTDIIVSGSGSVWTIDSNAVTNSKINDVAWGKVTATPTTLAGYGITNALALSGGALTGTLNGTVFRTHNVFVDEANRETGFINWASDVFRIGTEKAGTGLARRLEIITDGVTRVRVDDNYQVRIGDQGTNSPSFFTFTGSNITTNGPGRGLSLFGRNNVAGGVQLGLVGDAFTSTSLASVLVYTGCSFVPTSGNGTFTTERIAPAINQTGGANGITRGVSVEPTLTSAADWRSFDTNVSTGFAYHSSGTAPSRLGGALTVIGNLTAPIGTTADLMIGTGASGILETKTPVQARTAIGVNTGSLQLELNGDGAVLAVGVLKGQFRVPYNCTITGWELVANESGSLVVDIEKDTYANFPPTGADSITPSNRPTLTASQKAQSTVLTGWTTALNEGDYIKIEVISVTSVTFATLTLTVART